MAQQQILKSARLPGGGNIIDVEGDLMGAKDSLAHCVSACLAMGKGIAVHFKNQFGNVDALKKQNIGVGGVAFLSRPQENRFIYYLITKPRYHHKPTYDTLRASLKQMVSHMTKNAVPSVSIPELGCGLDGLQWDKVYNMLTEEFANTGINVTVYHFRGQGMTAQPSLPANSTPAFPSAAAAAAAAASSSNNNNTATNSGSKATQQQQKQQQQKQNEQVQQQQQQQPETKDSSNKKKSDDKDKFPDLSSLGK